MVTRTGRHDPGFRRFVEELEKSRDANGTPALPTFGGPTGDDEVSSWFIGPRAENIDEFTRLIQWILAAQGRYRAAQGAPEVITDAVKGTSGHRQGLLNLTSRLGELLNLFDEYETPYFSPWYQAHMLADTTMAAQLGYMAGMMRNPNNVTIQASSLTTHLERIVGWDICSMIGFPFNDPNGPGGKDDPISPHGHLTSGGTVANTEALWSARELKFLAVAAKAALYDDQKNPLYWLTDAQKRNITVRVAVDGQPEDRTLDTLSEWQLLNVPQDEALNIPCQIMQQAPPKIPGDRGFVRWSGQAVWEMVLQNSINALGPSAFYSKHFTDMGDGVQPIGSPVILIPVSKHYSWPKAMGLLGFGSGSGAVIDVKVDELARMDVEDLRKKLNIARANMNPVLAVVAVTGSTEESSIDDVEKILRMRDEFRKEGFEFNVHADAAWGGYYSSAIRKDFSSPDEDTTGNDADPHFDPSDVNNLPEHGRNLPLLSEYVVRQLRATRGVDSVTVDPHKTGYVPYPAGSICYRNADMRKLVTFGAPVIGSGQNVTSIGEFGIEGSKPGAAASAVYLSHAVARPSISGHGKLMNASLLATKRFSAGLWSLNFDESGSQENESFVCVPLAPLPAESLITGMYSEQASPAEVDGTVRRLAGADDLNLWLDSLRTWLATEPPEKADEQQMEEYRNKKTRYLSFIHHSIEPVVAGLLGDPSSDLGLLQFQDGKLAERPEDALQIDFSSRVPSWGFEDRPASVANDDLFGGEPNTPPTLPPDFYSYIREFGPDLNIVDYMFNFRTKGGAVNSDLRLLNLFNKVIYDRLHVDTAASLKRQTPNTPPVMISKTDMWRSTYGDHFVIPYLRRIGVSTFGPGSDAVKQVADQQADKVADCQDEPDAGPWIPGKSRPGKRPGTREAGEYYLDCYRKITMLRSVIMDPFVDDPDKDGKLQVQEFMKRLRRTVEVVASEFADGCLPKVGTTCS